MNKNLTPLNIQLNKNFASLKGKLLSNHPLAEYTSWKIGGCAEFFYRPVDLEDLVCLLQIWQDEPITVLGAATNVLIRDGGIKGLVIYLRHSLNQLQELDNTTLRVEAGVSLRQLVQKCQELGMVDAAFFAGIPGTIGGALKMNAGAYGSYIWHYVKTVEIINRQGKIKTKNANEFTAGYRQIEGLAQDEWFIAATFNFIPSDKEKASQQVASIIQKRENSQPLNFPSCGSVFRNPDGNYAAKLIELNHLKGKQIGGAKVSEKHANFIINCGNAKAVDVENLMQEIMATVEKESGIKLIPEVHVLGEESKQEDSNCSLHARLVLF